MGRGQGKGAERRYRAKQRLSRAARKQRAKAQRKALWDASVARNESGGKKPVKHVSMHKRSVRRFQARVTRG